MPESDPLLDELILAVCSTPRYQAISEDLVRQVGKRELTKGRKLKEAIKSTRSKLHQVAVAYQEAPIPYPQMIKKLATLSPQMDDPELKTYCQQMMRQHTSTAERLPILASFFQQILTPLAPIHSILDLACGLTPLALPWMPLAENATYYACDVFPEMLDFINRFFAHVGQPGKAEVCDLTQSCPSTTVEVALLLKSVPCLEQLDKQLIPRLLQQIPAQHIIVSFPARTLGGHQKGMAQFYTTHFEELIHNMPFKVQNYSFSTEIAFLLSHLS